MSKPSLLLSGFLAWIASAAWYLALVSSYGVREFIAAAFTAVLAALATMVFARTAKVAFHLRWRDLLQAWRLPGCVLSGTWEIMRGLAKQLFTSRGASSVVAAVPFDVGDRENLADAGRRALAITYTSGTPNFLILGIVDEQQWFLYHQIMPGDILTMTKNLGARP
jgi:hypothetical protein